MTIVDDGSYPPGFFSWLTMNQHIYQEFAEKALEAKAAGITCWSANAIREIIRWETALRQRGDDTFKLNNNYVPGLARFTMAANPELDGFFKLRRSGQAQ